jgi:hypothetical protein
MYVVAHDQGGSIVIHTTMDGVYAQEMFDRYKALGRSVSIQDGVTHKLTFWNQEHQYQESVD